MVWVISFMRSLLKTRRTYSRKGENISISLWLPSFHAMLLMAVAVSVVSVPPGSPYCFPCFSSFFSSYKIHLEALFSLEFSLKIPFLIEHPVSECFLQVHFIAQSLFVLCYWPTSGYIGESLSLNFQEYAFIFKQMEKNY